MSDKQTTVTTHAHARITYYFVQENQHSFMHDQDNPDWVPHLNIGYGEMSKKSDQASECYY